MANQIGLLIWRSILSSFFVLLIGASTIYAADVNITATAQVPGKNYRAEIIVEPKAVLADGQSQIAVLVLVNNPEGEPLNNQTVTLSTSRPDKDVIDQTQPVTNLNGVAVFKLKSQFTGETVVTAAIGDEVIGTAKASFFSRSRAFFLLSSPLIFLAGLFVAFEFLRWWWLLGFWRRRDKKKTAVKLPTGW